MSGRAAGAAMGLLLDAVVGDPPNRWHPVAWFGRLASVVDRVAWADDVRRGRVVAAGGAVTGALAARAVPLPLAVSACAGARTLGVAARRVAGVLEEGDLDAARQAVPWLVGRDASSLDATGLARAAIESVAENTVDAVVAPVCLALVAGRPGVGAHRAINTLDAMVGHRTPRHLRFGRASAKADDALAWIPARVTVALVALARPQRALHVVRAVLQDAAGHPSPNAGVAEAAFAGALRLTLGGPVTYGGVVADRPALGRGRSPGPADIERAVRLLEDIVVMITAALAAVAVAKR